MSIEEIMHYYQNPSSAKFIQIADQKETEIDIEIQKLKYTKTILKTKKEQLYLCAKIQEEQIIIEECEAENISMLSYDFMERDISHIFTYLKDKWSIEQIRMGIGSFISLDKVIAKDFKKYNGIYTYTLDNTSNAEFFIKPKGKYLCGYQKGAWDKASIMYEKMLKYAQQHNLKLTGYAYEIGLNEFAISSLEEYITKFMIKIDE